MGIFNYESKFMQIMLLVADYLILNLVYLLCCIPIFTIGAAQAGLYAGIRTLLDKNDDSPCLRSFFKGFRTGFGTITIVWTIFTLIIAALVMCCFYVLYFEAIEGLKPQLWMVILALVISVIYQSNLTLFHSNFGCTKMQLVRNVFFTTLAHPLRSVGVALLTWIPVLTFYVFPVFLQLTPVWLTCYFSIAFLINGRIMAKPYQQLTENFVAAYEAENGEITVGSDDSKNN